jgi:hypothetical protein
MRRFRRNATAALTGVAIMLGTAACGGGDEPQAGPGAPTAEPPATSASPTTPTPTEPPWHKKYTPKQIEAYESALARWETYEDRSEPIWAAGEATVGAAALFRQYFPSPLWRAYYGQLESYEDADVQVVGTAGIYWSKPSSITKDGHFVKIQQCVDYTLGTTIQAGKKVPVPDWVDEPNLRTISLSRPKGYNWLIYRVVDASSGKARPCVP